MSDLEKKFGEATQRWRLYENEFILPCFELAKKSGIDLHQLVIDKAGKNCVILLVEALQEIIETQQQQIKAQQMKIVNLENDLNYERSSNAYKQE